MLIYSVLYNKMDKTAITEAAVLNPRFNRALDLNAKESTKSS